jgi:hypothetical protein
MTPRLARSLSRKLPVILLAGGLIASLAWALRPRTAHRSRGALPQSVYVWQRAWREPVRRALEEKGTNFSSIVALGAEVTWERGQARVARISPDYEALRATGRPIGVALRIGPCAGPFAVADERARWLAALAASLVAEATNRQVALAELQIDFDCAESKLAGYQLWVEVIRRQVQPVPVLITVLPAWLKRPACRPLLAAADGYVLQVHSLARPKGPAASFTLCDPQAARQAVEKAARLGRPFRVALPTYGYVMAFDASNKFIGLSAEGPALNWPAEAQLREVCADPQALARLVAGWSKERPEALRGVIWYRLPVEDEALNWSWATLAAVMAGREPGAQVRAVPRHPQPGLVEVDMVNRGEADLTQGLGLAAKWNGARLVACDGLAGFEQMETRSNSVQFRNKAGGWRLRAGETRTVGWLRFDREVEVQTEVRN